MRDARGRFHRPDPLADLATYVPLPPAPVTDPWGVPAHAYRRRTREPWTSRRGTRSRDVLAELAAIRVCGCTCHAGRNPHNGNACECGPVSAWAARLGLSAAALQRAERRARS